MASALTESSKPSRSRPTSSKHEEPQSEHREPKGSLRPAAILVATEIETGKRLRLNPNAQ